MGFNAEYMGFCGARADPGAQRAMMGACGGDKIFAQFRAPEPGPSSLPVKRMPAEHCANEVAQAGRVKSRGSWLLFRMTRRADVVGLLDHARGRARGECAPPQVSMGAWRRGRVIDCFKK